MRWHANAGYGTEAVDYVVGLLEGGLIRPHDMWLSQSGDGVAHTMQSAMLPHVWESLLHQDYEFLREVRPSSRQPLGR